jgi:hypothetical protein
MDLFEYITIIYNSCTLIIEELQKEKISLQKLSAKGKKPLTNTTDTIADYS